LTLKSETFYTHHREPSWQWFSVGCGIMAARNMVSVIVSPITASNKVRPSC
jgi:hypothetical protein